MRKLYAVFGLLCATTCATPVSAQTILNSFETSADMSGVSANYCTFSQTTSDVTNGKHALKVNMQPAAWPRVNIRAASSWDVSAGGAVAVDVTNTGAAAITLNVQMYDIYSTTAAPRYRVSSAATIASGQEVTLYMPFVTPPSPSTYGLFALPPYPSNYVNVNIWGTSAFDFTHVSQVNIYTHDLTAATTIVVDNLRVLPTFNPASLTGLVDKYGQSTLKTWTGKIAKDSDLIHNLSTENTWIAANPVPAERDSYGAWKNGPTLTSTGYFYTTQYNGKWWLVAPNGHLFFTSGIEDITPNSPTIVDGRNYMFQWLPTSTDPLAVNYGTATTSFGPVSSGNTFDFYRANLQRKYGSGWVALWENHTVARMQAWGFNTASGYDNTIGMLHKMPYIACTGVMGTFNTVSSQSDWWAQMPDPFDPNFVAAANRCMSAAASYSKSDPWCIGYAVDNELSWGKSTSPLGLAYGKLAEDASTSPAKSRFPRPTRDRVWNDRKPQHSLGNVARVLVDPERRISGADDSHLDDVGGHVGLRPGVCAAVFPDRRRCGARSRPEPPVPRLPVLRHDMDTAGIPGGIRKLRRDRYEPVCPHCRPNHLEFPEPVQQAVYDR